jgi:ATP-binding cassette subfamily G (WHITE) protein 2 (SNQ2)
VFPLARLSRFVPRSLLGISKSFRSSDRPTVDIVSVSSSTRGLDASTALEFVRALRIATDVARTSTIVSIYQAGESLYQHFDKVCVLYEGRMVYFGRADQARQYFINLGFEPAHRQTTADFLVAGMLLL